MLYILICILLFKGKRGLKAQFLNVASPNEECVFYDIVGQSNVVGNRTYLSCGIKQEDTFASLQQSIL